MGQDNTTAFCSDAWRVMRGERRMLFTSTLVKLQTLPSHNITEKLTKYRLRKQREIWTDSWMNTQALRWSMVWSITEANSGAELFNLFLMTWMIGQNRAGLVMIVQRRNNCIHHYIVEADMLKSSFTEVVFGCPGGQQTDHKPTVSWSERLMTSCTVLWVL